MPFTDDTFTHLFDWEKDPQRQDKIVDARLEAEFDGVDTGLSSAAARLTAVETQVGAGLADNSVTNAKLADMPAFTLKARNAGTTGDPSDLNIAVLTEKTALANADLFLIQDSAAGNAFKKVQKSNLVTAASDTIAGTIEIAVQSEMEAGTDTTRAVTSGRQHFHPSAAKVWCAFDASSGTPTIIGSYNTSSITDRGVGRYTVNFAVTFSSTSYCSQASVAKRDINDDANMAVTVGTTTLLRTASSCPITTALATPSANLSDTPYANYTAWGDL
jgi:hypothetical protein